MCRFRFAPFAGSVTTNAKRFPSGEYCKSEICRKFSEASGVSNFFSPSCARPRIGAKNKIAAQITATVATTLVPPRRKTRISRSIKIHSNNKPRHSMHDALARQSFAASSSLVVAASAATFKLHKLEGASAPEPNFEKNRLPHNNFETFLKQFTRNHSCHSRKPTAFPPRAYHYCPLHVHKLSSVQVVCVSQCLVASAFGLFSVS
jgi:hypothetical protein